MQIKVIKEAWHGEKLHPVGVVISWNNKKPIPSWGEKVNGKDDKTPDENEIKLAELKTKANDLGIEPSDTDTLETLQEKITAKEAEIVNFEELKKEAEVLDVEVVADDTVETLQEKIEKANDAKQKAEADFAELKTKAETLKMTVEDDDTLETLQEKITAKEAEIAGNNEG